MVDEAHGSIIVDGERVELAHILVEAGRDFPLAVLISDVPLPAPCEPLDSMVLVEQQPFSGLLFTIGDDLTLWPSMNGLYHPSLEPFQGYGQIQTGLNLERSDSAIHGTLRDVVEVDGREFAIDAEMTIQAAGAGRSVAPRTVEGADSEPRRAFEELVDAVVAGDVDAMLARSSSQMREELESAGEIDAELLLDFADFMLPVTITILDAQIDGDSAVLAATGESVTCTGTEHSDGTIEMIREDGAWKVKKVSWRG